MKYKIKKINKKDNAFSHVKNHKWFLSMIQIPSRKQNEFGHFKYIVKGQNFLEGKFRFHPKATKNFGFPEYVKNTRRFCILEHPKNLLKDFLRSQGVKRGNINVLDYSSSLLKCKKAQEDSTLVWIAAIFIIMFILMIYFFIAFSMAENKSFISKNDIKQYESYYSQDISLSQNLFSVLNNEINFNGRKEKVISAIADSFESYFETKNTQGSNLVEKYGLDNYNDISRTSRNRKISDGFKETDLDKIDRQNQELTSELKNVLDRYCSKYRLAIPQGMITEKGKLESSDALGSRIYFVLNWGDNAGEFSQAVGFNITRRGFMTYIKFTQLKECSGSKIIGGQE